MQKYRIRPLRLEKGWSQEQLATIAGLSTRTVQRIENGEQASLETLTAIAAALGSNLLVKVVLAFTAGGRRFGLRFMAGMALPALVFGLVLAAGSVAA